MQGSVNKPQDGSQRISNEQPAFYEEKQTNHQNPTTPGIAALCQAENLKAVWARALERGSGLR